MESVDSDPLGMIALIISDDEVKLEFDEECPPEQCSRKNENDISLTDSQKTIMVSLSSNLLVSAVTRKLIQLIFLTFIALLVALIIFVWQRNFQNDTNTALIYDGKPRKTFQGQPAYTVLLTGDSLNLRPWEFHNLGGRIQNHLPTIALFFRQESFSSYTMAMLNNAIGAQVTSKPDITFIAGDTDASSVKNEEWKMTSDHVSLVHQYYQSNVTAIIDKLRQNVSFFAFSGPFLLGEHKVKPFYQFTAQPGFKHKRKQLNDYVQMNEAICQMNGVKYINLHKKFSHVLPSIWPFAKWYVTVDGEHPNQYGTILMAREYALAIKEWLKLPDSAWRD